MIDNASVISLSDSESTSSVQFVRARAARTRSRSPRASVIDLTAQNPRGRVPFSTEPSQNFGVSSSSLISLGNVPTENELMYILSEYSRMEIFLDSYEGNLGFSERRRRRFVPAASGGSNAPLGVITAGAFTVPSGGASSERFTTGNLADLITGGLGFANGTFTVRNDSQAASCLSAKDFLGRVPVETLANKEQAESLGTCPICLCDYKPRMRVRKLSCGHQVHKPCFDAWARKGRFTCPLDNVKLTVSPAASRNNAAHGRTSNSR